MGGWERSTHSVNSDMRQARFPAGTAFSMLAQMLQRAVAQSPDQAAQRAW